MTWWLGCLIKNFIESNIKLKFWCCHWSWQTGRAFRCHTRALQAICGRRFCAPVRLLIGFLKCNFHPRAPIQLVLVRAPAHLPIKSVRKQTLIMQHTWMYTFTESVPRDHLSCAIKMLFIGLHRFSSVWKSVCAFFSVYKWVLSKWRGSSAGACALSLACADLNENHGLKPLADWNKLLSVARENEYVACYILAAEKAPKITLWAPLMLHATYSYLRGFYSQEIYCPVQLYGACAQASGYLLTKCEYTSNLWIADVDEICNTSRDKRRSK
jgi:hypothetical protein